MRRSFGVAGNESVKRARGLAAAVGLAFAGCAATQDYLSPTDGYQPSGEPAQSLETAKSDCLSKAEFRDASGLAWTNWEHFEACMKQQGWVRHEN